MDVDKIDDKVRKIRKHLRVCVLLMEQIRKECIDHPYPVGNFPYPECLNRRSGHNCPLALRCNYLKALKDALHDAMRASAKYIDYVESHGEEYKDLNERNKRIGLLAFPGGGEGT